MTESPAQGEVHIGGGRQGLVALAGCIAFCVFGVALAAVPGAGGGTRAVGVVTVAVFGALGVIGLVTVTHRGGEATIVFAQDGIRFPAQGYPTVPWSRVEGARVYSSFGQRFLAIDITDPDEFASHRGPLGRLALRQNCRGGHGAISISEQLAPTTLEDLAGHINRRIGGGVHPGGTPTGGSQPPTGMSFLGPFEPRILVGFHGLSMLLSIGSATGTGQQVRRGVFAVLLLCGALLIRRLPRIGLVLVVATEVAIILVTLTLGHTALPIRIVALFIPVSVLMVLGTQPSKRR